MVGKLLVDKWSSLMIADGERKYDLLDQNKPPKSRNMNFLMGVDFFFFVVLVIFMLLAYISFFPKEEKKKAFFFCRSKFVSFVHIRQLQESKAVYFLLFSSFTYCPHTAHMHLNYTQQLVRMLHNTHHS